MLCTFTPRKKSVKAPALRTMLSHPLLLESKLNFMERFKLVYRVLIIMDDTQWCHNSTDGRAVRC